MDSIDLKEVKEKIIPDVFPLIVKKLGGPEKLGYLFSLQEDDRKKMMRLLYPEIEYNGEVFTIYSAVINDPYTSLNEVKEIIVYLSNELSKSIDTPLLKTSEEYIINPETVEDILRKKELYNLFYNVVKDSALRVYEGAPFLELFSTEMDSNYQMPFSYNLSYFLENFLEEFNNITDGGILENNLLPEKNIIIDEILEKKIDHLLPQILQEIEDYFESEEQKEFKSFEFYGSKDPSKFQLLVDAIKRVYPDPQEFQEEWYEVFPAILADAYDEPEPDNRRALLNIIRGYSKEIANNLSD